MDNRRYSNCLVASRLSWIEHQPKVPENGQLDSCSDRDRRHSHHFEPPWGCKPLAIH